MESAEREAQARERLAEMVWHLTECEPREALAAIDRAPVRQRASHDEKLLVVARAVCRVRRLDLTDKLDLRERLPERPPAITS
jgi:hypothetical protein